MRQENGKVGSLLVSDALSFNGLCEGPITVTRGGELHLNGTCGGQLIVEAGATAIIRGMAIAGVANHGGTLDVHGVIRGGLARLGGTTTVHPRAQVS